MTAITGRSPFRVCCPTAGPRGFGLLDAVRHAPVRISWCCRRAWLRAHHGRALDFVERHGRRERGQVLGAHLRGRFEARRELDQRLLTESRAEEADAEWDAKHHAGWHLYDRVARPGGQAGCAEDEVVTVEQVGGPS